MALVDAASGDDRRLGFDQEQQQADLNTYMIETQREVQDIVSCLPDEAGIRGGECQNEDEY